MKKEIGQRRQKFANRIRERQHQEYFQLCREKNVQNLPIIAFLPLMINQQLYEELESVLDCIQVDRQVQFDKKLLLQIEQRAQHHAKQEVRKLMTKLINRITKWSNSHISKAIQWVIQGSQQFIKQLSIYLENQQQNLSQELEINPDRQKYEQEVHFIYSTLIKIVPKKPEYRICWLDIVNRGIKINQKNIEQCDQNIDSLFYTLQMGINNFNQFQMSRILCIITKISEKGKHTKRILSIGSFPKILMFIKNGSIDMVINGLDMLADMLSQSDQIVRVLVSQFNILEIYDKYLNHILYNVQTRVLWGLSNILCSVQYVLLFSNRNFFNKVVNKSRVQNNLEVKCETYYCMLNLLCTVDEKHLAIMMNQYSCLQMLAQILQQMREPIVKGLLLQRALFTVCRLVNQFGIIFELIQSYGIKKWIKSLYEIQKEEANLQYLNATLIHLENAKSRQTNDF